MTEYEIYGSDWVVAALVLLGKTIVFGSAGGRRPKRAANALAAVLLLTIVVPMVQARLVTAAANGRHGALSQVASAWHIGQRSGGTVRTIP